MMDRLPRLALTALCLIAALAAVPALASTAPAEEAAAPAAETPAAAAKALLAQLFVEPIETGGPGGSPCNPGEQYCCLDDWQPSYNCPTGQRWACCCTAPDCSSGCGNEIGCVPDSSFCLQ